MVISALRSSTLAIALVLGTACVILPTINAGQAFAASDAATPNNVPLIMPDDAAEVAYDGGAGSLAFSSAMPVKVLAEFYRAEAKKKGWSETPSVINKDNMTVLTFTAGEDALGITIIALGNKTQVEAEGSALETKGQSAAAQENSDAPAATASAPLVAIDRDGLPIPDGLGNTGSESTQFSKAVNFSAPNSVAEIVAFYRSELTKKGWKEDQAKISETEAEISFTTSGGPATLTVKREGDMSNAVLSVKDKAKAAASPLAPKAGKVKLLFANLSEKAADVAIGKKHVKVPAGAGSKGPDGPSLEVAPGDLTASMKGAKENFKAGPDEIWMIGIGPGGLIVIQQ